MPFATSRADALMHAVVNRAYTEVQVHVSAETLTEFDTDGCCHVHDGPNLAPHTVRRLSCIEDDVPQLAIAACAEALPKQRNAQFGLAIDETTAFPNWDGEPMDRAMAIDGMFSASGDFQVR